MLLHAVTICVEAALEEESCNSIQVSWVIYRLKPAAVRISLSRFESVLAETHIIGQALVLDTGKGWHKSVQHPQAQAGTLVICKQSHRVGRQEAITTELN